MKPSHRRAAVRLIPLVIAIVLAACGVTAVNGPASVTLGQNATYDYAWGYGGTVDPANATNGIAELTVFVPIGWTVVSATYNGTVNGAAVSGTANSIAPVPCVGAPPAGYQAFGFSAGPFPSSVAGDNGVFHITYAVGGSTGAFTLVGRGSATTSTFTNTCGDAGQINVTVAAGNPLGVSKAFSPTTVAVDAPSTLTFTLTNANDFVATGVAFTDTYPAGLVNATTPAASTTCGAGTVTAVAGGNTVALSGGSIPAGGTCTVSVAVSSAAPGTYANTLAAAAVTSTNAPPNATAATASLIVAAVPAAVPALDPAMLALLAIALGAVAFFAMRR